MSAPTRTPVSVSPRQEFMRTDGFALYTDINDQFMDTLSTYYIPSIPENTESNNKFDIDRSSSDQCLTDNPGGISLYLAMRQIDATCVDKDRETFERRYGVTSVDEERTDGFTFAHGFGDINFPWHFAAGLANATADFFIQQGKLTKEQKNRFTLHDWANIIGTGWFSRLAHLMALSSNGTYGSWGYNLFDYTPGSLAVKLKGSRVLPTEDEPVFEYSEQKEPLEERVYATAGLSQIAIKGLRARMRRGGKSVGCPVARYSVLLPQDMVQVNPHVQNLLQRGTLSIVPDRSTDKNVRATQDWSAIDKTLSLFAAQLDNYAASYGTPYVNQGRRGEKIIKHRFGPSVDVLRWAVDPNADS